MISATSNMNTVRDSSTVMPAWRERVDREVSRNTEETSFHHSVVFSYMVI